MRNVKLDGEPIFAAPDITPKGVISSEMVRYKGQKLKIPAAEGNWYIRWEEGSKPKWQRAASMTEAIGLRVRKQYELQALSAGIEIKADDPSRLRLADALQQYVDDQNLLKRSKKTLAAYRTTKETFLKSCHRPTSTRWIVVTCFATLNPFARTVSLIVRCSLVGQP